MDNRFREIDDLVLQLKGLVLVRELLASRGAGADEIDVAQRRDRTRSRTSRERGKAHRRRRRHRCMT